MKTRTAHHLTPPWREAIRMLVARSPTEPIILASVKFLIVYPRTNNVWLAGHDQSAVHTTEPGFGSNDPLEFVVVQERQNNNSNGPPRSGPKQVVCFLFQDKK